MEKFFKLKENKTTVGTEIIGGLTTFFAMAYIIFVNPNYLSATGMDFQSVMIATCVSAAIGCLLTALLANAPFAQAPGMGLNAFFAFTVATGSLGFGMGSTLRLVILPQALRRVVAPLSGQIISLIKDSSLVSAIAVADLTLRGREAIAESFLSFEIWLLTAGIYLGLTLLAGLPALWLEKHINLSGAPHEQS